MELSLRLDTLGMVELRYLRRREQYRDWPQFQLTAMSRQAVVNAYMSREVAELLHQQILTVEEAVGLDADDDDDDDDDLETNEEVDDDDDEGTHINALLEKEDAKEDDAKPAEREASAFSPAFAQALKQLNELARQRLPDAGTNPSPTSGELPTDIDGLGGEDDMLIEQLQDAFIQMMSVIRDLAEEISTDALKITGRFKCARTNLEFVPQAVDDDDDEDDDEDDEHHAATPKAITLGEEGVVELEIELVMVLQLFEEGRSRPGDEPTVELQLDVDDFERLHETLDAALEHERRSRRRR